MPTTISSREPRIYQLHVTLDGISPFIWRRIHIESKTTLAKLHLILQSAFGWMNSHFHGFKCGDDYYSDPDFELEEAFDEVKDERRARLHHLISHEGDQFIYEYDFGDSWQHGITVERITTPDERMLYPLCTAGARACPPEDIGGGRGYAEFLAALKNDKHEEHDRMLMWVGGVFDSEGFDLNTLRSARLLNLATASEKLDAPIHL